MKAKELCARAGIDQNKLHHWVINGVVSTDRLRPGRGREREYTDKSLRQAICAESLLKYEMSVSGMKRWMGEAGEL